MKRKQAKKEARERTLLKVPNTAEGQKFLADLRKYRTGGTRVWCRGRGPRAVHAHKVYPGQSGRAFDQSLPVEYASYFGVYVWKPAFEAIGHKREREAFSEAYERRRQNEELARVNEALRIQNCDLRNVNETLRKRVLHAETEECRTSEALGSESLRVVLTIQAKVVS